MAFSSPSRWKTPNDSVITVSCYFNLESHRKITHLPIFSSSDPSSSSSSSSSCDGGEFIFRNTATKSSLKKSRPKEVVATAVEEVVKTNIKGSLKYVVPNKTKRRRPFWKKILRGSKKIKSIILLNVVSMVYASNIIVVKEVEAFLDPAAFSAVRFAVSALSFLPFVFQARNDAQIRKAGIELGVWVGLGSLTEAIGLVTSDAGRASFLSLFTIIVVPVLESMLGTVVPARTWFGVLMSVLGVGMLECSGSPPSVGDLLNFLSAIFFGIHTLRTEHISRSTKEENFLALLGYQVGVVALLSTIWYLAGAYFDGFQDWEEVSWTWTVLWDRMVAFPWIPAIYTGLFSTGLCLWAEIAAMRDVSALETATIYGLEPLWGAGFAWVLLGERWGIHGWIGAALILGGTLMVQIFGSSSGHESRKSVEGARKDDLLMVTNKKKIPNTLSVSPVIVSSRKEIQDMSKK